MRTSRQVGRDADRRGSISWVLRHKALVVIGWVVLVLVGFAFVTHSTGALDQHYSLPGKPGYEASKQILQKYGNGGISQPLVAVVQTHKPGAIATSSQQLASAMAKVHAALPQARIASYASTGDQAFVSHDGAATFALIYPTVSRKDALSTPGAVKKVQRALRGVTVGGAPVQLTGLAALTTDAGQAKGPGVMAESMIGGLGALAVLIFVFGSCLAVVPLLIAIAAIPATFLVVWGIAEATSVSIIVEYFVALLGLGLAIDYALLIVFRWREELAKGVANSLAVRRAMSTAGRAVVVSGTTVAIAIFALVLLPVPFLRSLGFSGLFIPLISVAAAVTLLPALLASIGPKVDRVRFRKPQRSTSGWTRWAQTVFRFRITSIVIACLILAAVIIPVFSMRLGESQVGSLAHSGKAHQALQTVEKAGFGDGVLSPFEVLTTPQAASNVAQQLGAVPGVRAAVAPTDSSWQRGGTAIVDVFAQSDPATSAGRATFDRVRNASAHLDVPAKVGGITAQMADLVSSVYGHFGWMVLFLAVVSFALMARAFRSVVLPLKALVMNVLSMAAACGVMVFMWQEGHGSQAIYSLQATHVVTAWVPVILVAFLFGISMDYEVFIVSRMREEYDRTGSTRDAVSVGIGRTGRLVTSAAAILFLAFIAMSSGPQIDVKVLATGLAAGIFLDATVVRSLLVPAIVALFGCANWWMPRWLAIVLRVPRPQQGLGTPHGESPGNEVEQPVAIN